MRTAQDDVELSNQRMQETWHGLAAEAMTSRVASESRSREGFIATLTSLQGALDDAASAFTTAVLALQAAFDEATAAGFTVSSTGEVTQPFCPSSASTSTLWETLETDMAMGAHTNAVQAALARCQTLDEETAWTLTSISNQFADLVPQITFTNFNMSSAIQPGSETAWLKAVTPLGLNGFTVAYGPPGATTGEYGGGFVVVDGVSYPVVVPQIAQDGTVANTANTGGYLTYSDALNGADPGWSIIGTTSGQAQFGTPASGTTKTLATIGMILGDAPAGNLRIRGDLLGSIGVTGNRQPTLDAPNDRPDIGEQPDDPRDNPVDRDYINAPEHLSDREERFDTLSGILGELPNLGNAVSNARHLDDPIHYAYQLQLEQNSDGRKRAILTTYQVFTEADSGQQVVQANYGYFNAHGNLQSVPITSMNPDIYMPPASTGLHLSVGPIPAQTIN